MITDQHLTPAKPPRGIFNGRESFGKNLIQRLPSLNPSLKLSGLRLELLIGERLILLLKFVDARDDRAAFFNVLAMVTAREFLEDEA